MHLSDIHFGQDRGGEVWINEDIKRQLVEDVRTVTNAKELGQCAGVIVSGDIAFSGSKSEYQEAAHWLDSVTEAAGCKRYDVQLVPGNHDVDRSQISKGTEMILKEISANGESALYEFLKDSADRELLFRRFAAYMPFAEAYGCSLSLHGAPGQAELQLAAGRKLRIFRLNSALACSREDERGQLILGARQRVLHSGPGEEIVVICHHPVDWLQDSDDTRDYVRNRARVFMSGHEHCFSVRVERDEERGDVAWLGAGATIPSRKAGPNDYIYSFIEFSLDAKGSSLCVDINPRVWTDDWKSFRSGRGLFKDQVLSVVLSCPNFASKESDPCIDGSQTKAICEPQEVDVGKSVAGPDQPEGFDRDLYRQLLLRFFRDLLPGQRMSILAKLGAVPADWSSTLSESFEREAFDRLIREGRIDEICLSIPDAKSDAV